jgi:tyrosinase
MSPVANPTPSKNPQSNGYGSNPRCVRRDITNYLSTRYGTTAAIVSSITSYNTIQTFQDFMQGGTGVHQVGHFTVSGDPGGDFYISPNEPSFWLHHAMIDRIWTIWQSQDYTTRKTQMQGGTSMFGGGRAQALTDLIDLGVVAKTVYKISDVLSTVDGPFCYVYQ